MADNRPSGYTEKNLTVYRASTIGSCLTALVAARLDYRPARHEKAEKILMDAAREGSDAEPLIIERLKSEYGWRVWSGQEEADTKVIPRVVIRGHVDGFCRPKGKRNDRLLEVKTMSQDVFKQWKSLGTINARLRSERFAKYGWQISTYMHAHQMPTMYVVKNRNTGELDIEELKVPPVDWKIIKKKIIEVEKWVARGEIPPCSDKSAQFFCEFPYLHDDGIEDEPDDDEQVFDSATTALLAGMAENYYDLNAKVTMLKALDQERKGISKRIIDTMGSQKKMATGGYSITRVDSHTKANDWEAVAKKLGVDFDELKQALEETKQRIDYSYIRVEKEQQ